MQIMSEEEMALKKYRMKVMRKTFSHIGFSLAVYDIFVYILLLASMLLTALIFKTDYSKNVYFQWILTFVCQYVLGFILLVALMRLRRPQYVRREKKKLTPGGAAVIGFICLSLMYIGSAVSAVFAAVVEFFTKSPMTNSVNEMLSQTNIFIVILMAVVIGPIIEELIYRKMILDRIRIYGERFAIIFSAAVFAIAHGNFFQVFYSFALGCMWGYLYLKTNNIKITIGYHMFVNFVGSAVPMLLLHIADAQTEEISALIYIVYSLAIFTVMITGAVLMAASAKNMSFEKSRLINLSGREKLFSSCVNVGMILMFLIAAIRFIQNF